MLFPLCLRMAKDPHFIPQEAQAPFFSLGGPGSPHHSSIRKEGRWDLPLHCDRGYLFSQDSELRHHDPHQKASSPPGVFLRLSSSVWASWAEQKNVVHGVWNTLLLDQSKVLVSLSRPPERLQLCQQKHFLSRPSRRSSPVFSAGR